MWKSKNMQKLLKSSQTTMNVLYLIMPHNNGNFEEKFQPSILNSRLENLDSPTLSFTDGPTFGIVGKLRF